MTYRDDDAELIRRGMLLRDRATLSGEGDEAAVLAIDDEIARIDESRRDAMRKRLPLVAAARIATPCPEAWDTMIGDGAVRSCTRCDKDVFDLSALTVARAEALLASRVGKETCARLFVRADGTMLFADCTVGVRGVRARQATLAVGAAMVAAAALTIASQPGPQPCPTRHAPAYAGTVLFAEPDEEPALDLSHYAAIGGGMRGYAWGHDVVEGTSSTFAPPLEEE